MLLPTESNLLGSECKKEEARQLVGFSAMSVLH